MGLSLPAPVKPTVSVEMLAQLDIRVGTIEQVLDVPASRKLIELRVNFGDHERTILVGMKQERPDLREVEGKQALFVINLEPRGMAGRISQGMLLDIGYADGIKPVMALPEKPVPNGARAG